MRERVLITGASSGIGLELAKTFARHGYDLVLVARRKDKLEQLAADLKERYTLNIHLIQKDLAQPEAAAELFNELKDLKLPVDILINNAGVGMYGRFRDLPAEQELAMLRLNILSLTHLTKLFLPYMLEKRRGKILNVASTAAFQPGPMMAVYYASKAYVLSFSEALWKELKGTGVSVSALCPGPTESEFQAISNMDRALPIFKLTMMDSQSVARAGYYGLMKGQRVIIPGFMNALGAVLGRISPRSWVMAVVEMIQKQQH